MENSSNYVTVAVACQLLGVSDATIRRFIRSEGIDGEYIRREDPNQSHSPILIDKDFLLSHSYFNKVRNSGKKGPTEIQIHQIISSNDKTLEKKVEHIITKLDFLIRQNEIQQEIIKELQEEKKALKEANEKRLLTSESKDTGEDVNFVIIDDTNPEEKKSKNWFKFW